MHTLIIIILTLIASLADAQTTGVKQSATKNSNETKREFENQGEQEDYWAEQLFKEKYSKQSYDRFEGVVVINGNFFKYDDNYLEVTYINNKLKNIFSKGILYPDIITGDIKVKSQKRQKTDRLPAKQKTFDNFWSTDSLKITDFEEVLFLSKSPKYKRFRFWLFRKFLANPTVCFIELTNENATTTTDLSTFINGSSLTFFKEGWVIM